MTWTFSMDTETGEVTLTDPSGSVVTTTTGSNPPTIRMDGTGEPTDPDIRAIAADHVTTQYNNGEITLPTAVRWAMGRFEVK